MGQQTPGREPSDAGAQPRRPLSAEELRRQTEERFSALSAAATEDAAVHELRVHQIELEMQNDALARAQYETEEQRAKYFELFDLASVGQLVLTDEGLVRDANLTAARALNVERRQLVGKPFTAFVCASDQDAYYLYRKLLEKTREPQSCELRLEPVGAEPVWARVESRPQGAADGEPGRSYVGLVDVPERVLAEERLRLSREHHSALVENVNVVTFTLDRQGTFTFVSPAIERLLGYTSAEMEGMPFSRFVHPDDRGALAESLTQTLSGITAAHELRLLDRVGAVRWVVTRNSLIAADGSPPSITGVMSDVSERKQAEVALLESEQRFRALVEWTPEAVVVHRHGKLIHVNPAAVRMFGATAARDLVGKPMLDLVHPDFHQVVLDRVEKSLEDGLGAPLAEIRYLKLDGTTIEAEVQGTPIIYDGEPAIHVALRDITGRKHAEEALRATTALLSGLLTSIPDIVFYKDTRGVYLGCNAAFARYAGRDAAAIVGATDHELFGKELAAFYREQDQIMMAQGEPRHNEEWVEYPDGTRVLLDTLKAPLRDVDGQIIGLLGVSRDVTERNQAEEVLAREAAALTEAYATITRIAATDDLTGLANRRHFHEVLEKAVSLARRHGSPLALVSIDLDGMKGVNDSAGHEAGDKVLTTFAALLTDLCRREDLAARLGGDEFSVVLPGIDLAGALGFAERVLAATRSCADLATRGVTVSGGVAALTDGAPPDDLLRRADQALYAAKRGGGDAVSAQD